MLQETYQQFIRHFKLDWKMYSKCIAAYTHIVSNKWECVVQIIKTKLGCHAHQLTEKIQISPCGIGDK